MLLPAWHNVNVRLDKKSAVNKSLKYWKLKLRKTWIMKLMHWLNLKLNFNILNYLKSSDNGSSRASEQLMKNLEAGYYIIQIWSQKQLNLKMNCVGHMLMKVLVYTKKLYKNKYMLKKYCIRIRLQ